MSENQVSGNSSPSNGGSARAKQTDNSYDWGAPQTSPQSAYSTGNPAAQNANRTGTPNSGRPSFNGASFNDVRGLRDAGREFLSTRVLSPITEKINSQKTSGMETHNPDIGGAPVIHNASQKSHKKVNTAETRGFFSALFDLSFSSFITLKFAKFIYIFNMVLLAVAFIVGLFVVVVNVSGFEVFLAFFGFLLAWVVFSFIWLVLTRLWIEAMIAVVRIAQNTSALREQAERM